MSTHAAEAKRVGFGFTKWQTAILLVAVFVLGFAAGVEWQSKQPVMIQIERHRLQSPREQGRAKGKDFP